MIKYTIAKHASAFPTNVLAAKGGAHLYSLECDKDTDNGTIVAKDTWKGMQYYGMKDSTGVEGIVLQQAANGNWYVEITKPADGIFIYQVPMIDETYNNNFQKESNFYNEKGEKVRGYKLVEGDVVEVSPELFSGEAIAAGKIVKITSRKYDVQV